MSRSLRLVLPIVLSLTAAGCGKPADTTRENDDKAAPITASVAEAPTPVATTRPELSCAYPVSTGESAAAVLKRFGSAAQRSQLDGPEGTSMAGIVLWGDEPRRRIELILDDEPTDRVVGWQIGEGSGWSFAGLHIGDSLSRLVEANAKPFKFYGFSWDYGGYVSDWESGSLEKPADGCSLSMRLSPGIDDLPAILMGDHELEADSPVVATAKARISEIAVGFPGDR